MDAIQIKINGYTFWFKDNHILEFSHSKVGIYLYSIHISKNEREQVLKQINK
jgi:hypothetical protein